MHQSGGKIRPVLRSLSPNFSIIYPFQKKTVKNSKLEKERCTCHIKQF